MTFLNTHRAALIAALACSGGCTSSANETEPLEPATGLQIQHAPDPALATEGREAFANGVLFQSALPPLALRNLYLSWSDDLGALFTNFTDEDGYWQSFNDRYGTVPSPFDGARYPAGFGVAEDGMLGIDCLLCHAGRFQGQTIIGLSNNRLDLRALVEDLQRLPEAIAALKMRDDIPDAYASLVQSIPDTQVPEPFASLVIPTGAAGLNDGIGLGLVTSKEYGDPPDDLRTFVGYEDPAPWWTIRHKTHLYTDGAATTDGIYTMMSTLLAFGLTVDQLATYLPTFEAIRHFQCSIEPPSWADFDLPSIDVTLATEGAALFSEHCASCHGHYDGGLFPDLIVSPSDIGTDAYRTDVFRQTEADWFNGFIPDERGQMSNTDGYLAPVLTGVWASAPYLHNGSVPTLRALLTPETRPELWRRSGDEIDPVDVGLTFEVVADASDRDTPEQRRVVDTRLEAMGNGGHTSPSLAVGEVDAILEYLKQL